MKDLAHSYYIVLIFWYFSWRCYDCYRILRKEIHLFHHSKCVLSFLTRKRVEHRQYSLNPATPGTIWCFVGRTERCTTGILVLGAKDLSGWNFAKAAMAKIYICLYGDFNSVAKFFNCVTHSPYGIRLHGRLWVKGGNTRSVAGEFRRRISSFIEGFSWNAAWGPSSSLNYEMRLLDDLR